MQVVDETWAPAALDLPPHKRTVPLTMQQVLAQLPRPHSLHHSINCLHSADLDCYGRDPMHVNMFGPALTRLTADLAANILPGKQLVCWMPQAGVPDQGHAGTAHCKEDLLGHMVLLRRDNAAASGVSGNDSLGACSAASRWPPVDRAAMCHAASAQRLAPGQFAVYAACTWPCNDKDNTEVNHMTQQQQVRLVPSWRGLLVTSDAGYSKATAAELQEYENSTAAADADRFDALLSSYPHTSPVYVFLDPHPLCVTGRCKAPPGSIASAACLG